MSVLSPARAAASLPLAIPPLLLATCVVDGSFPVLMYASAANTRAYSVSTCRRSLPTPASAWSPLPSSRRQSSAPCSLGESAFVLHLPMPQKVSQTRSARRFAGRMMRKTRLRLRGGHINAAAPTSASTDRLVNAAPAPLGALVGKDGLDGEAGRGGAAGDGSGGGNRGDGGGGEGSGGSRGGSGGGDGDGGGGGDGHGHGRYCDVFDALAASLQPNWPTAPSRQ
mmetsp:Transcript_19523/g.44873  ORF Transcript_19523/g.44873 Transcript_19523/m.44873 type:complete len:225 (-) Transcript_19523:267-941(-)